MRFYNVHKLIAYRQTPLTPVCPRFYPHTNVCLFVPVASYYHLSVRPSVLVYVCHRLFVLVSTYDLSVRTCIRMSPSVLVSSYDRLSVRPSIPIWTSVSLCPYITVCLLLYPHVTVSPSLYPHVIVCLPLFPRMIVSLSVFPFAYYHGEFVIPEPNGKRHFGALCTHGSQLTMQTDYAICSRVWRKICNTSKLFGTTERWGSHRAIALIRPFKILSARPSVGLALVLSDCCHLSFHPYFGKFQLKTHWADFQKKKMSS